MANNTITVFVALLCLGASALAQQHYNEPIQEFSDVAFTVPAPGGHGLVASVGKNTLKGEILSWKNALKIGAPTRTVPVTGGMIQSAATADTAAYITCEQGFACTVSAVDIETGKSKWTSQLHDRIPGDGICIGVTNDGATIVVGVSVVDTATPKPTISHSEMLVYDTHSGHPKFNITGTASDNEPVRAISVGATVAAMYAGANLVVGDLTTGKVIYSAKGQASSDTICIAPNGEYIAYGFFSLEVYARSGKASYSPIGAASNNGHVASACAIADNSLVVGWSRDDYKDKVASLYTMSSTAVKLVYADSMPVDKNSIYQDVVSGVAITADAKHFVIGSWGSSNATVPRAHVYSVASKTPIARLVTDGSLFSVAIDAGLETGKVLVAGCGKHEHANKMGDGGDLYVWAVDEKGSGEVIENTEPRAVMFRK